MEIASAHTPTGESFFRTLSSEDLSEDVRLVSVFDEGRVEMTDFGREGISFLRFNHPTPPRNSNNNNNNGTPAVQVASATSSFPSHQFYS